ncbi:hypothetical protein KCP74_19810 [Salmonella enterica subsp. enterica]|nr:hypothetical protein KCP74_19810 [Salmonella enterica subsp. enterica]
MERLIAQVKIRRWGVSNLDYDDMQALWRIPGDSNARQIRCSIIWRHAVLSMIYVVSTTKRMPVMAYSRRRRRLAGYVAVY